MKPVSIKKFSITKEKIKIIREIHQYQIIKLDLDTRICLNNFIKK
jgi:hypothetical protein